jgi:hypothetical protein
MHGATTTKITEVAVALSYIGGNEGNYLGPLYL